MNCKRNMPEEKMISLLQESEISGVTASIPLLHDLPDQFFESGVASGDFISTQILLENVPAFRMIWKKVHHDLHLLYLQTLGTADISAAFVAARRLAMQNNLKRITLKTARAGMVENVKRFGGSVTGVFMEIKLA